MKQHLKNEQARAHAWAHALQPAGQAANLFFTGTTIYSYGTHFPIAAITGGQVYFTTQRYSATTAKHKSIVRSAVSHRQVIYVPSVPVSADDPTSRDFQKRNVAFWVKAIKGQLEVLHDHPKRNSLLAGIKADIHMLHEFTVASGCVVTKTLAALLQSPTIACIRQFVQTENRKQAARERLKKRNQQAAFLAAAQEWETGLRNCLTYTGSVEQQATYLRLTKEKDQVETSKGIYIPVTEAFLCYNFIQKMLHTGCFDTSYRIGGFAIDEINSSFLKVGCHTIPMRQVDKIAALMNWL